MIHTAKSRRGFLTLGLGAAATLLVPAQAEAAARRLPERSLHLYNTHTGESLKTVYWAEGQYQTKTIAQISRFLRDHRSGQVHPIDPRLLDVMASVQRKVGAKGAIHIISGYRSPSTNAILASYSDGVATHSLHTVGKAVDIRLPGHQTRHVGKAAKILKAGGVGIYPDSDFVHIDTGKFRTW
ncbi:hypothetical protein A6A04_07665 [Paramagnetospirillum marisnigri]|uniref:Murein endopeptidase K n=1 Tax=Paramagnetospirillum marisnigri TaxID=1285242 RepID=A0A178M9I0_9PROT|nr:DUF882 domain-containing protein [Paramagnetospirillum marisnigri]OAN44695.1 hypothetical protein A6A04_07665 [Paramagnetospirillum marisnigri]